MGAPQEVLKLVDRFHRHRDSYAQAGYKEAQVCVEFIMPMFHALGWDVYNEQGYAEAYKDVVHQHSLRTASGIEAPDYCFRIGGTPKFFLEAKKPAVHVGTDISPAYQLRRYAWTAKLHLSILTDFEEFAVYDTRLKPGMTDKAAVARVQYLPFDHYPDRWDEIASVFSRDAVLKGSFDKYAEAGTGKKGTSSVDASFLQEIEVWRDGLARNLALRNKDLSVRELNFAVQRTIDRILFLRICEDRGIENYGRLQTLLNGQNTYRRLFEFFQQADERYNSGLFHFRKERERDIPDDLTPRLVLDDRVLKEIIEKLYYPESPYEFSILPADVLGQVYEQFLGKVIRLTAGHQAKVEDKPEVKKAGGVYYTPTYIVEYIVKNTVGKLLEGCKSPKDAAKLRILDPACGSGSFLIVAYQTLLNWHLDWYTKNSPESLARKANPPIYQAQHLDPDGAPMWALTTAEKKRVLLNGIYGVDIDSQAVEVTKLSLMLKVLEGESEQTINTQMKLFHERALPDLSSNIKCGNSLIGPDFYEGKQLGMLDQEEMYRVNVFDWKRAYPAIMEAGGFDAVIGNPPYVRQEGLSNYKNYFSSHYAAYESTADLYSYFMERGIRLLREGGRFSVIVSSSFLRASYGRPLRAVLKESAAVLGITDFGGLAVFEKAKDTYVCIPLLAKQSQPERVLISRVHSLDLSSSGYSIPHARLSPEAWSLHSDRESKVLAKLMQNSVPLGEYLQGRMYYGVKTGYNDAFVIESSKAQELVGNDSRCQDLIKPFVGGQDIRRFSLGNERRSLIVIPSGWTRAHCAPEGRPVQEKEAWSWLLRSHPGIGEHLGQYTDALRKRQDQGEFFWELRSCDYYDAFARSKIIFPDICKGPRFYLDHDGLYLSNTAYCIGSGDPYILGILNSKLFWFSISHISIPFGVRAGEYRYRLIYQYMSKIPIRQISEDDRDMDNRRDRVVGLASSMPILIEQHAKEKATHEREAIRRRMDATDRQIDQLVYELYGLTDAEIAIVEGDVLTKPDL